MEIERLTAGRRLQGGGTRGANSYLSPSSSNVGYGLLVLDSTGTPVERDFRDKVLPGVPRHRGTAEVRVQPAAALTIGAQVEWQSTVFVETSNAETGTVYFRSQAGAPVQQVPFRAVPARALFHVDAALHLGPAAIFASVENVFGRRYSATVVANEGLGRFYEPGPPALLSVGVKISRR